MKIFISWSGALSKAVAEKLKHWLKDVIQALALNEPFVSSDIAKGDAWFVTLLEELDQSSVGIVCVTRENLHNDWLLFEAGALARQVGRPRVCTLLVDVSPMELPPPLSGFQATTLKQDDVFRLVKGINSWLQPPPLSEKQLEGSFNRCWGELESHIRDAIAESAQTRSGIHSLAEDLLLPMIYHHINAGQLETVFYWLGKAKQQGLAGFDSQLGLIEGCLARITGKKGAGHTLRQFSLRRDTYGNTALLELMILEFAARRRLSDTEFNPQEDIDSLPESLGRSLCSFLALWHLREARQDEARDYFERAVPGSIAEEPYDYYRAVPLGITCFALGDSALGERYFNLAKVGMSPPYEGYPFVSAISEFDRAFVNTCVGQGDRSLSESFIRDFRGHAWVMVEHIHFMRRCDPALNTFVELSQSWRQSVEKQSLIGRLHALEKKLISVAGSPLVS